MPAVELPPFKQVEISGADGGALRLRVADLRGPVRAEVIVTHGLGEHSGRYGHVAAALAEQGFRTWTYDLRGHGKSCGQRGDASSYSLFLEDLAAVLAHVGESARPRFLLGHSFGGQITLRLIQLKRVAVAGAIVASPWLRLAFEPPRWRIALAHLGLLLFPGWSQRIPAAPERLSRDAEHLLSLPDPELNHRRLSPRLFFQIVKAGRAAIEDAPGVQCPLLLIHGDDDPVTSASATQELYDSVASKDKKLSIYAGARHETHNDLGRERVLADICAWLEERVGGGPQLQTS